MRKKPGLSARICSEAREEFRSIGQMLRATSRIGEQLVLDHLGSLRRVTIVAISKGRVCFEWTTKTAGITRRTWINDLELGLQGARPVGGGVMTAELRVTAYCLDCCTTNTVARPLVALATLSCVTRSHAVALLHDAEAPRAQWARRTYHRVLSTVRHRHVESFGHLGGLR